MAQKPDDKEASNCAAEKEPSPKSSMFDVTKRSKKAASEPNPSRFQGQGVTYKGKLIGEQDVDEARGDDMCAEAMRKAKAAIKATNIHKPRILLRINIEGIKLIDEHSDAVLHNFPVANISFIARDATDIRAFGFIFLDSSHKYKYYGIKTAQEAEPVVLAIRDMFQIAFEMMKDQFDQVKQQSPENLKEAEKCGTVVTDLLDLETELLNMEQGIQQLPSKDPFETTPFAESFTLFNSTASTLSNSGINHSVASQSYANSSLNEYPMTSTPNMFAANQLSHNIRQPLSFSPSPIPCWPVSTQDVPVGHPMFHLQQTQRNAYFQMTTNSPLQYPSTNPFASITTSDVLNAGSYKTPIVDWTLQEHMVQQTNGFALCSADSHLKNDLKWNDSGKRVASLEEAFSKLVDMDKIVGPLEPAKKGLESNIVSQKVPFNCYGNPTPAVNATTGLFGNDFFSY